ncbi:MAG: lipoate--protein ligase family protein [Porphyromonadaceae bacterium]|nr:lipoate--protein ligase family protein [Porphyromonadaceae bacterium]
MNIVMSPSSTPSFNLAAEEYLFSRKGEDFLLLYVNEPSVIIGSNQAVRNEVDPDFCIEHDIRIIRRLSGGGAVYHDRGNLNYTFIQDSTGAPLSARFLEPVVTVLHKLDIPVEIGKRKDLWLEGYKISGTASHVSRGRELHHGTLLYDTDLEMLQRALTSENGRPIKKATPSVPSPVTNIRTYLARGGAGTSDITVFLERITTQLLLYYGEKEIRPLLTNALEEVEQLRQEKYTQQSWNCRL